MNIDSQRAKFAEYLHTNELLTRIQPNYSVTISQSTSLKYERIDKYEIMFLTGKEITKLCQFCKLHDIELWLGADLLCIGYNYRGNMRLSAYEKVNV